MGWTAWISRGLLLLTTGILPAYAQTTPPTHDAVDAGAIRRGAYLAVGANCASCHTAAGGRPLQVVRRWRLPSASSTRQTSPKI